MRKPRNVGLSQLSTYYVVRRTLLYANWRSLTLTPFGIRSIAMLAWSSASAPCMTSIITAKLHTSLAIGPAVSNVGAKGTMPARDNKPTVGFKPYKQDCRHGRVMEPSICQLGRAVHTRLTYQFRWQGRVRRIQQPGQPRCRLSSFPVKRAEPDYRPTPPARDGIDDLRRR